MNKKIKLISLGLLVFTLMGCNQTDSKTSKKVNTDVEEKKEITGTSRLKDTIRVQKEESDRLDLIVGATEIMDRIIIDYSTSAQIKEKSSNLNYYEYLLHTDGQEELNYLKEKSKSLEEINMEIFFDYERTLKDELLELNKKQQEIVAIILSDFELDKNNKIKLKENKDFISLDKKIVEIKNHILSLRPIVLQLAFFSYDANIQEKDIESYMYNRQFLLESNLSFNSDYYHFLEKYSIYLQSDSPKKEDKEDMMKTIEGLEKSQSLLVHTVLKNTHFEKYQRYVKEIKIKEHYELLEKNIDEQRNIFIYLSDSYEKMQEIDYLKNSDLNMKRPVSLYLEKIVNFYVYFNKEYEER